MPASRPGYRGTDSVLVIWVYGPRHDQAFKVAEAWGYSYKSEAFVWVKVTQADERTPVIGKGYYTRKASEQALLFTRGNGLRVMDRGVNQVLHAPRREHSRKPDEVAEALERLFGPVRRIELFARHQRAEWVAWGNELRE